MEPSESIINSESSTRSKDLAAIQCEPANNEAVLIERKAKSSCIALTVFEAMLAYE